MSQHVDAIPVGDVTYLDDQPYLTATVQPEPLDWSERIAARLQRAHAAVAAEAQLRALSPSMGVE